jgi:NitT/TauT family transport system substrate-binding protein
VAKANNSELIARVDRGILQPQDLKGRQVGVSRGMNTEFLLGSFLAFHGMRLGDLQIVNLRPSGLVAALAAGEIDAASLYPPFSYEAKARLGGQSLSWSTQGGQEYFFLLTTTADLLKTRSGAITSLLAAVLEAETYLKKHSTDARGILARKFQLAPEQLAERMTHIRFQVGLHQDLLTMMEDEAHWAMANGAVRAEDVPNLFQVLSLEPLENLKPEAVGVIH